MISSLISQSKAFLIRYPAPLNIGYLWNFGSIAALLSIFYYVHGTCAICAEVDISQVASDLNEVWRINYGALRKVRALDGCTDVKHIVEVLNEVAKSCAEVFRILQRMNDYNHIFDLSDFDSTTQGHYRANQRNVKELFQRVTRLAERLPLCDDSHDDILLYLFINDARSEFDCNLLRGFCSTLLERGSVTQSELDTVVTFVRQINAAEEVNMHTKFNEPALNLTKVYINKQLEQLGIHERLKYTYTYTSK